MESGLGPINSELINHWPQVVLGGGLVGIKKALALAHHNVQMTVVEKEAQILLPRLDRQGPAIMADKLAEINNAGIFTSLIKTAKPLGLLKDRLHPAAYNLR